MTSSGLYNFNPGFSEVVLAAYARIGRKRPMLTAEHFMDAGNEGNFLLGEWSNKQPNLWKSELISQALTEGTATYVLPARVVMILCCYINTGSSPSTISRVLGPLSTVEYASIPNKENEGVMTSFWFNRLETPEITFWPVPDDGGPYTAEMRVVSQAQDVTIPSGTTIDVPYRALDAFTAGLAYRLARIHAPELEDKRKADAMEAWMTFSGADVENVPLMIVPSCSQYYR